MKKDIHPTYYQEAKVTCACGNSLTVGATQEKINIEICSKCHPFYTGSQDLIDTAGRAEKFKTRQSKAKVTVRKKSQKRATKKAVRAKKKEKVTSN